MFLGFVDQSDTISRTCTPRAAAAVVVVFRRIVQKLHRDGFLRMIDEVHQAREIPHRIARKEVFRARNELNPGIFALVIDVHRAGTRGFCDPCPRILRQCPVDFENLAHRLHELRRTKARSGKR